MSETVTTATQNPVRSGRRSASAVRWQAAGLALVSLSAGLITVACLERFKYERLPGYLQAKSSTVSIDREARIGEIKVSQGMTVRKGDPLFVLVDEKLDAAVHHQRGMISALEKELAQTEAKLAVELDWKLRSVEQEIFETKLRSATFLRQQFSTEIEQLAWGKMIAEIDSANDDRDQRSLIQPLSYYPPKQEEDRIAALLRQEAAVNAREVSSAQVEMCDARLAELETVKTALPDKIRKSMGVELVGQRLDEARQELKNLERQQQRLTVTAPRTGIVGLFHKQAGEFAQPHEPIVQLLDEDQPFLVVEVSSKRIAEFKTGNVVSLVFPGNVRGEGRIERIPPQTSHSSSQGDSLLALQIEPAGKVWPNLPFGSQVEVLKKPGQTDSRK